MKIDKVFFKLLLYLGIVLIISIFMLLAFGESRQDIFLSIFYAMLFLPIEVYATVFFLNTLIERREELLEEAREDSYYFKIAQQSQQQLIYTLKKGLVENFISDPTGNIIKDFERLYQECDYILDENFWRNSMVDKYALIDGDLHRNIRVYPLTLSTEIGKYITGEISDFYSVYLKFIPLDIFQELHGIYQSIEVSLLFGDNPYIVEQRYKLIQKQSENGLDDKDCQDLVRISRKVVKDTYERIKIIEDLTKDHYIKMYK